MQLTLEECVSILINPRNQALVARGRKLEARHELHIEGESEALYSFLTLDTNVESAASFASRKSVSKPATKPLYAGVKNILSKVFTAHGTTRYFQFSRPEFAEDFEQYLDDTRKYGVSFTKYLEEKIFKNSLTRFQGVYMVDLPADLSFEPSPYVVFIPSSRIYDIELSANRVEYVVVTSEVKTDRGNILHYTVTDDTFHRTFKKDDGNGKITFSLIGDSEIPHNLDYVPACPASMFTASAKNEITRTSILAPSLEFADAVLRDDSSHEYNKLLHANEKMWSYAVTCEHENLYLGHYYQCDHGYFVADETRHQCGRCKGEGKYVAAGPDKVYWLNIPDSKDSPDMRAPAGYIQKDLTSTKYLGEQIDRNESKLEKSILGKEGILAIISKQQTLGEKEMDWQPVYDLLRTYKKGVEYIMKFCLDTMARLRYDSLFISSSIQYGERWVIRTVNQIESEFDTAKKAGMPDSLLFNYLEEIIYTRHHNDPKELDRNLIKLYLTPFPTCTLLEVKDLDFATREDKTLRLYINDYIDQFELDNGDITEFGILLSFKERITRIKAILEIYNQEKLDKSKPIVPPAPANPLIVPQPLN